MPEPIVSLPQPTGVPYSRRQRYVKRKNDLWNVQSSFRGHWRELSDNIMPRKTKFFDSQPNQSVRNDKIINGTPRWALRVLASGMMAGVTSPSRPWFKLTVPDKDLADNYEVRNWLDRVENEIRMAMLKSNIYNCLHNVYEDLGTFATSAMLVEEDTRDIVRGYNFPVGSYALATDDRGMVDTTYRSFFMTTTQLVRKFGEDNVSERVKRLVKQPDKDSNIRVVHAIEPNDQPVMGDYGYRGMPYRSCWFEDDTPDGDQKAHGGFLRESGYREFPVMAPRWFVNGEDTYGSGPSMDGLGDCKALQFLEKMKASLVHKTAVPPMVGPASLANRRISLLPGDITLVESTAGVEYKAAIQIPAQALPAVSEYIMQHELRIKRAFFADLWLMMAESDRREMTAAEVAERHSEKLLQLGPVMERLQRELLEPLIDRIFMILLRSGRIPAAPRILQGMQLSVEYVSIMAQAQKMVITGSIERLAGFLGQLAAVRPDVLDNVNWDHMVSTYAEALGVPPDLVLSDDQVADIRKERADQQRQQMAMEQAKMAADTAAQLGQVQMDQNTMATDLAGQLQQGAGGFLQ